jgi:hypothetical protein
MHILVGHINRRERERDNKKKRRAGVGGRAGSFKKTKVGPKSSSLMPIPKRKKNEIKEEKKLNKQKIIIKKKMASTGARKYQISST